MARRRMFILAIWTAILVFWALPILAQVDTAWVRRYQGPENSTGGGRALAVDSLGNVYVIISSGGYLTIKYYPNGDTAWVRRYDGPEGKADIARAVTVDGAGNVYVTGQIDWDPSSALWGDYGTIKYYPNGDTAWVRRYFGPGNQMDAASAIAVDSSGNVYVTGRSGGDYATLKYYPNGDTAWVRRYYGSPHAGHGATAIALDASGNIYVTGQIFGSGTYLDYVTIKYYPDGDTAWVRRYDGFGGFHDFAKAIAVDASGSVYVTGSSYVGSWTGYDCVTIKYYHDGRVAWVARYSGLGGHRDDGTAVTTDRFGNVYVAGWTFESASDADYLVIKYHSSGQTSWVRQYNGPGNWYDYFYAMALDGSGSVYLTGSSWGGHATDVDYATVKYDMLGNRVWVQRYNGPGNAPDGASAIAVDASGSVYVTGGSHAVSGTRYDCVTIKYVQTTDVKQEIEDRNKPSEFSLFQNHPNPFNQNTKIRFDLPKASFVSLNIYDVLGRKVRSLVSERLSSGHKSVLWDGKNDSGEGVASGIYFYQLRVADFPETKKLVLLK